MGRRNSRQPNRRGVLGGRQRLEYGRYDDGGQPDCEAGHHCGDRTGPLLSDARSHRPLPPFRRGHRAFRRDGIQVLPLLDRLVPHFPARRRSGTECEGSGFLRSTHRSLSGKRHRTIGDHFPLRKSDGASEIRFLGKPQGGRFLPALCRNAVRTLQRQGHLLADLQ